MRGDAVRVVLTGAAQDRLREENGLLLDEVRGRALDAGSTSLTVQVELSSAQLGFGSGMYLDTLQLNSAEMRDVQVREFSTSRTVLGVGVGLGAVFGAWRLFSAEDSGSGGGEGGEVFARVPFHSVVSHILQWSTGR